MHDPNEHEKINPRGSPDGLSADETPSLDPKLRATEAAWARLQPRMDRLDRDRLMFLAGQASVAASGVQPPHERFNRWFWPAASGVMTGVAAALLVALVLRPEPAVVERLIHDGPVLAAPMPHFPATLDHANESPVAVPHLATPGVWTVRQRISLTGDLLGSTSVAQTSAGAPGYRPAAPRQPVLSARSFQELLDDIDHSRAAAQPPSAPRTFDPGAKS